MAFEKLETRAASGRGALPATVALTSRGARPAVLVSLTRDLIDAAVAADLLKDL